jgi:peroxiredoxin (alkyl hydroperoxide reductase subunit C)
MKELKDGCVKPAKGPIFKKEEAKEQNKNLKEEQAMKARVGKEAIDFEANAFLREEGFKTVRLSDYRGKWIVLCFYPGDFTFV